MSVIRVVVAYIIRVIEGLNLWTCTAIHEITRCYLIEAGNILLLLFLVEIGSIIMLLRSIIRIGRYLQVGGIIRSVKMM